jgi:hypothetical protein
MSTLKGYLDKNKRKSAKDILKEKTEMLNTEKDFYEAVKNNRNAREAMNDSRKEYSNFTKTKTTNKDGDVVEQIKETWKEPRKKK